MEFPGGSSGGFGSFSAFQKFLPHPLRRFGLHWSPFAFFVRFSGIFSVPHTRSPSVYFHWFTFPRFSGLCFFFSSPPPPPIPFTSTNSGFYLPLPSSRFFSPDLLWAESGLPSTFTGRPVFVFIICPPPVDFSSPLAVQFIMSEIHNL